MISPRFHRTYIWLTAILSVMTAFTSVAGIIHPDIYRPFTPDDIVPVAAGRDIISLAVAIILLFLFIPIRKGVERLWLIWVGLTGYLMSGYAIYSFEGVYNSFFIFYVAIWGLSLFNLIFFFYHADLSPFKNVVGKTIPANSIAAFLFFLVFLFGSFWVTMIFHSIQDQSVPQGNTLITMDLGFFLPLLFLAGILTVRKKTLGLFLTVVLLIRMAAFSISMFLGSLLGPFFEIPLETSRILIYAVIGLGSLACALFTFTRIGPVPEAISERQ